MVTPFTLAYTNDATGSTVTYTSDNITNINVDFNTNSTNAFTTDGR